MTPFFLDFNMGSIDTAIPKGSLVLVTGVNGFVGSHVADQFLAAGYRVRGTARDLHKTDGLGELWKQKYGQDSVEFVQVTNMSNEGAFDEAVKGIYHPECRISLLRNIGRCYSNSARCINLDIRPQSQQSYTRSSGRH